MSGEIVLTMFWPERLRQKPQRGVRVIEEWDRLCGWLSHPMPADNKGSNGGFVLADLADGIRAKDHVVSVSALSVDVDHTTMTATEAHAALSGWRHVVHTTHSHARSAPRWRAILAFSRPPTAAEYSRIWPVIAEQFAAEGIEIDPATKDPCRLWYVPEVRPGGEFEFFRGEGEAVDVDRLLEIADELSAERAANQSGVYARADVAHDDRYVRGALDKAAFSVATAGAGARNRTLNAETHSLARLDITASEIERVMLASALAAGLSEREARRTIASALRARRQA